MAKTTVVQGGSYVTASLRSLSLASSPATKKAMAKRLKEAGEIVAAAARSISSGFSTRIPGSIRVMGGVSSVRIVAGGPKAPNALPFERGKRHPLFGYRSGPNKGCVSRYNSSKGWYVTPKRPFLEEAEAATITPAVEAFASVIDDWLAQTGWK